MRDPVATLLSALERDRGGIAVVWCPDLGVREWLVGEVDSLVASTARAFRTSSVEEAIGAPDRMALLVPADESEVVLDLDGSRDRQVGGDQARTQPIVLFLLRDGDGARTLAQTSTSLWSVTGGSQPDPEALAEIDPVRERRAFLADTNESPEQWLLRWRAGEILQTSQNFAQAYRAMLLETA